MFIRCVYNLADIYQTIVSFIKFIVLVVVVGELSRKEHTYKGAIYEIKQHLCVLQVCL